MGRGDGVARAARAGRRHGARPPSKRITDKHGKPGLGYGPLAPRKVDVVPDHHLHQFGKANPSLPAVNAARLGRIAAQRIDVSRRPLITAIYFDVLPVESNRRESELDEIAHVTEIDTRAATRRKVVIERQIFVSCRRMSASGRARRRRLRRRRALSPPSVGPEEQRIVEPPLRAIPGRAALAGATGDAGRRRGGAEFADHRPADVTPASSRHRIAAGSRPRPSRRSNRSVGR
jgi:hypothetical protein